MSFSQQTKDTINGWGSVFRFITPIMLTIIIFILNGLNDQIKDVRDNTKVLAKETQSYFTNHLSHHAKIEKDICERLAVIETKLTRR